MAASMERELEKRIVQKVADARAHAEKAVTQTLKVTPDGRATARKATASPSYHAAIARLDELLEELVGPSLSSLEGMLRDMREAMYKQFFKATLPSIPTEFRRSVNPQPTVTALTEARSLMLHGRDLREEIGPVIDKAKQGLKTTIVLAGARDTTKKAVSEALGLWEQRAADAIARAALLAHGDAMIALERIAGRDLIKPELLEAI